MGDVRHGCGSHTACDLVRQLTGDRKIQVEKVRTLKNLYDSERSEETTFGVVFATMLTVVLLFSGAGIHTLVVFAVVLRRREIGIRSALGAPRLRLVADVFRKDLSPVVAGAIVGAFLALPIDKLIQRDDGLTIPIAFVFGGFACMLTIGLLAIAGPARRALSVDSVEALRAE
jgi:ABC-type antimicrobial peptide transport system permease subunit